MDRRAGVLVLVFLALGCVPTPTPVVTDPDPMVKIPAMKQAVEKKDLGAAKQMIEDLENTDPAIRMYSITGLRKLTGEDFGYEFWAGAAERDAAVDKWKQWLANQPTQ